MRFEFKERKEKAKASKCFTKQGVSDNAYCVKYYLHKKKTTSDNYDQIAHGELYVLRDSVVDKAAKRLISGRCGYIDILMDDTSNEVVCCLRDERIMVSEYVWFDKNELLKLMETK